MNNNLLENFIKLEEKEKIVMKDNEKITLNDDEKIVADPEEKVTAKKEEKKPALGLFGNMFDLNDDGVIDEKEHEKEKEFLENLKKD